MWLCASDAEPPMIQPAVWVGVYCWAGSAAARASAKAADKRRCITEISRFRMSIQIVSAARRGKGRWDERAEKADPPPAAEDDDAALATSYSLLRTRLLATRYFLYVIF